MLYLRNKVWIYLVVIVLLCLGERASYAQVLPEHWGRIVSSVGRAAKEADGLFGLEKEVHDCYAAYVASHEDGRGEREMQCFIEDLYLQYKAQPIIKQLAGKGDSAMMNMPYYINPIYAKSRIIIERSILFDDVPSQQYITHIVYLMSKTPIEKWGELK